MATARMETMRTVTVITLAFQNVRDAPSSDAQNVTESRKPCEVPSFPQVPRERSSGNSGPGLLWGRSFICYAPEQTGTSELY